METNPVSYGWGNDFISKDRAKRSKDLYGIHRLAFGLNDVID